MFSSKPDKLAAALTATKRLWPPTRLSTRAFRIDLETFAPVPEACDRFDLVRYVVLDDRDPKSMLREYLAMLLVATGADEADLRYLDAAPRSDLLLLQELVRFCDYLTLLDEEQDA